MSDSKTTMPTAPTVVVFTSDRFDHSWPTDTKDPNWPPLGQDAAVYVQSKLAEHNIASVPVKPIVGEGGWSWNANLEGTQFRLFLHWAPIGNPPQDAWVIQVRKSVGLLAKVFGRPSTSTHSSPLMEVLKRIIEHDPTFQNVQWLTAAEFKPVY